MNPEIVNVGPMGQTLRAYAKINLTLDVLDRRSDGFHNIASVMQTISLHDTVLIDPRDEAGIALECECPPEWAVPRDETNLAAKAARAILARSARPSQGVRIRLRKSIPPRAGLGGGSSDAACVLAEMNRVLGMPLDAGRLHEVAASLGSDVPFFLRGGTAAVTGRGEVVRDLPDTAPQWLVVVMPRETVATSWAYEALDAIPNRRSHESTERMEIAIRSGDVARFTAFQSNDFEEAVFAHYPTIAWLADELSMAGALNARLCGSGAAVYAMAESEPHAKHMAARFDGRYPHVFICRAISRAESTAGFATDKTQSMATERL